MSLTRGSNLVFDCLFVTEDPAERRDSSFKKVSRKGAKKKIRRKEKSLRLCYLMRLCVKLKQPKQSTVYFTDNVSEILITFSEFILITIYDQ